MKWIHKIFALIMVGLLFSSVQAMGNDLLGAVSDDQLEELDVLRACVGNSCDKVGDISDLLCEINEELSEVFTVFANFSITLSIDLTINPTIDLSVIFTALAFGFYDTQTIVCEKFEQTWTILQKIDGEVNEIFAALALAEQDEFNVIAFGFYDTQTIICEKFEQTWTMLAPVVVALCSPQEILQANIGVTTYTISQPGFYVFAENIVFSPASGQPALEITTDNVTIDMCGKSLTQGNAVAGVDGIRIPGNTTLAPRRNVTIMNGGISGFTRSGIVVGTNPVTPANTAARFITIKNMKIFNCSSSGVELLSSSNITGASLENLELFSNQIGASLTNVVDSSVKSCDMILNTTGISLNQSSDTILKKCKAHKNTQAGFALQNAHNNTITNCVAIKNGQGGSTDAYGFVTQGGYANVFEECIAESTVTTATADTNVAAGFALTGTERCTKIINCESLTNTTLDGFATPYGILITSTFPAAGFTLSVTVGGIQNFNDVSWSSDGKYLAAVDTIGTLSVYVFDPVVKTLSFLVFVSHGASLNSVAWSPDGNYIAIGGALSGGFTVRTYLFDAQAGTLTNVGTANTTGTVNAVAWSPNGLYLLVGYALTGSFDFTIYRTKGNEGGLILAVRGLLGAGVNSVDWLDNKTFAVGGPVSGGASIKVFSFSPEVQGADPLSYEAARPVIFRSLASPGIDIQEVRWSPDKRYLAACGNGAGTNIFVYTFNNGTTLGSSPATATFGATANSLDWSPDGKYIGVGGINTQGLRIYGFSRTAFSLSSPSIVGVTSTINGVSWSPSGEFFATADNGLLVTVYNALVFNAIMNIVKNNIVYGNNGNSLPSGLGISGSSFSNIIVSNTAYNNQFDYEFVTNVFSSGINGSPSILENVSVPPY